MTLDEPAAEVALGIAAEYVAGAVETERGLTWTGPVVAGLDGDRPIIGHGEIGASLYDGSAGVALMLAAAAAVATARGLPTASTLEQSAVRAATGAVEEGRRAAGQGRLGLFEGATGMALAAASVGGLHEESGLLASAEEVARTITGRLGDLVAAGPTAVEVDLIGGAGGVVLGLLATRARIAGTRGLALDDLSREEQKTVLAAGRWLARSAVPQTWGSAWPATRTRAAGAPLLGLGHGCAGICLALAEIASLTGDEVVARALADGLEYERGWYDPDRVGWPDLRPRAGSAPGAPGEAATMMSAWCHGAIGIGLSRAAMLGLGAPADPRLRLELSAALQAVRDRVIQAGTALHTGVRTDCTPCHGLAGPVELLLAAENVFGLPEHGRAARQVAALIVEQGAGGSWPCGIVGAGEMRGLMTGRAGVALTLLRAEGFRGIASPLLPGTLGW